jgi:hypothetical protein
MRAVFVVGLIVCSVLASGCATSSTESGEPVGTTVVVNGDEVSITSAGSPTEVVDHSAIELFAPDGLRMDIAETTVDGLAEVIIKCESCDCDLNTNTCKCTNCTIE